MARIHDIDVRLHPTFALVFLWVLIDWRRIGTGVGISSILFTLILVILIFACVLLHEFGHAFMARQHGVRVHDVSLSAVGGVARMEQLPADPRAEVLIARPGQRPTSLSWSLLRQSCFSWRVKRFFVSRGVRLDGFPSVARGTCSRPCSTQTC